MVSEREDGNASDNPRRTALAIVFDVTSGLLLRLIVIWAKLFVYYVNGECF